MDGWSTGIFLGLLNRLFELEAELVFDLSLSLYTFKKFLKNN